GKIAKCECNAPGPDSRTLLGVAHPLALERGGPTFGALVVAKPKTELRSTWLTLMKFFGVAFLGGLIVAGGLAWYLGRRITRPVLGLSSAADQIAGGDYAVAVPEVPGGGEIGHLADRFAQMARRLREAEELERNFLMTVSHELRTPLTAIRGHVAALREGLVEDPSARADSLDVIAAEASRLERLVSDALALAAENGSVSVSVSDSGPGIKETERERIFRPFWSRDGGGTGLGLAIARELASALGGRIELDSSPGRGSRFELVLPATP